MKKESPIAEDETVNKGYIKTGYEKSLKEILLKKNLNIVFINGEFGSGKTRILKYALNSLKNNNKNLKVKNLKVYEEYIESNYIDYLYDTLKNEEKFGWKFLKEMWYYFWKKRIGKAKVNKINYIKKYMQKYDYLIIDDLDRVYIKKNEILKMIHFLQENLNDKTKLILLGDKSKFKEQGMDVLEKYYDFIFEVPKDILKNKLVEKINEYINSEYKIEYSDDLNSINSILNECTPRQLIKILDHLKVIKNSQTIFAVVEKLYRSDFLFILIEYYKNNININKLLDLLHEAKTLSTIKDENGNRKLEDEILRVINDIGLSKNEIEYLIGAYEAHIGEKNLYFGYGGYDGYEADKISEWRIFANPHNFNLNTFMSNKDSLNILIKNFKKNLYKDYEKTEYPINEIVRQKLRYEDFEKMLLERIEKVDDIHSRKLFNYIYDEARHSPTPDIDSYENINLQYYSKIIRANNFSEMETYNSLNTILNDENWKELHYINKLDFLCRECYVEGVEQRRRDEVIKDPQEVIKILDKIIENPVMPSNFWNIFEDKIQDVANIDDYINFILEDMKKRTNFLGEPDAQHEKNIREIETVYKNKN